MPAAPIMGLIFFLENRLRNLANSTPPAVSKMNATSPRPMIISVSTLKKYSACIFVAIVIPRKIVTRLASTFCAVSERLSSTPHSRIRLPNIKKPTSATLRGATNPAMTVMMIGKRMRVVFETSLGS